MAVWLIVYGEKKFSTKGEKITSALSLIENRLFDLSFLQDNLSASETIYSASKWKIKTKGDVVGLEYFLSKTFGSIHVLLHATYIEFIGPFEHFSVWAFITDPKNTTI